MIKKNIKSRRITDMPLGKLFWECFATIFLIALLFFLLLVAAPLVTAFIYLGGYYLVHGTIDTIVDIPNYIWIIYVLCIACAGSLVDPILDRIGKFEYAKILAGN